MFRSVFGRADQAEQPQPGAHPEQPGAHPSSADGVSSLNPLSRQPHQPSGSMGPGVFPSAGDLEPGDYRTSGSDFGTSGSNFGTSGSRPNGLGVPAPGHHSTRRHFSELETLSNEELRGLLTDPVAYRSFLHSIEDVKQMDNVVDDLQASNVELAKSTLAMETEISELQTQCRIIRGTELASAREQLQHLLARQQEVFSKCGPSSLVAKVQEAAQDASRDSEELKKQLAGGDMDVSSFIREYREKRKLYHVRNQTALAAMASLSAGVSR